MKQIIMIKRHIENVRDKYEIIDNSFDQLTALVVASRYSVMCSEHKDLADIFVTMSNSIKSYGYNTAITLDAINDYMQIEESIRLHEGIEHIISLLQYPVLIEKLPRNHRLNKGLSELFSQNRELPNSLVVLARTTYDYITSFDWNNENNDINDVRNSIVVYLCVYKTVISS